jgi:peptidoglycan/LPS O-acetylase OafA/YrhL
MKKKSKTEPRIISQTMVMYGLPLEINRLFICLFIKQIFMPKVRKSLPGPKDPSFCERLNFGKNLSPVRMDVAFIRRGRYMNPQAFPKCDFLYCSLANYGVRFASLMEASSKSKAGLYYPALTGVRALAAYMVFFHHFVPTEGVFYGINLGYIFGELHIGVTFFFVLSGFLIHNRYSATPNWTWPVYRNYFIARVARIIPLFFLLNLVTFIFLIAKGEDSLTKNILSFILNATLLKGFFSGLKFSGIPQSWSLTVEFCFYSAAPFLFYRIKNVLLYPRVSFILLLVGFLLVYIFTLFPFYGFIGDNRFMLSYTFLGRSFEFFVGCFLSAKYQQWASEKSGKGGWMTYGGLALVLVALYVLSLFRQPANYGVHTFPGLLVNNFFLPVAIILFFRGLLFETTVLGKLLSGSLFQLLGKASYAFYLIHVGFISKFFITYITANHIAIFILINLVSIALFHYIEEPLNLYFRKTFVKKPVRIPVQTG